MVEDRTVRFRITAEIADLQGKLRKAGNDMKSFATGADKAIQKNRGEWSALSTGIGALGLGLVGLSAMAVKGFAGFDKSLSRIKAQGGEAAAKIDDLRAAAVKAGADTQYSASEAADAITDLSKAGLSVADILGGGLSGSLALAAAGEMDVKQAAEVTSTALAQFGLDGSQAGHVADLLAAGANKAMGEVSDLGMALQQGGLIAHQTGLSVEETVGALTAFAKQGLLGSDAGTSLKTMLQRLTPQSKEASDQFQKLGISAYDSQGKFVGLANFAGQLSDKMSKLTPQARNAAMSVMFGSDAVRAANVLYAEGKTGIDKWVKAVNDQGFAARQAAVLTDNLTGDMERLGGSLDTALIQTGSGANKMLRGLTQAATGAVNAFGELPEPILASGAALTGAGGLGLAGVAGMMKLAGAVSDAKKSFKDLGISAGTASLAVGGVGAALAIGSLALGVWAAKAAEAESNTNDFASTLVVINGEVVRTDATMSEFNSKLTTTKMGILAWAGAGPTITDMLAKMGLSAKDAQDYLMGNAEAVAKVKAAQDAYAAANNGWNSSGAELSTQNLSGALDDLKVRLTDAEKRTLEKAKADEAAKIGATTYSEALLKQASAADGTAGSLDDYAGALFRSANAALKLSGSQIGFEKALDDTAAAIKKTGAAHRLANGQLDLNTKKGQDNQTALNQLAQSSIAYTQNLITQGKSEDQVQGVMERSRNAFIKQAKAAGMSGKAAREMADDLGLIPENVKVNVKTQLNRDGINAWNNYHPKDHFAKINVSWGSLPKTLKIGAKGTMRVAMAGGGGVEGPGTATSDEVPAMLSDGEHVLTASDVEKAGGQGAIYRMRSAIQSGMLRFAGGGAVQHFAKGGAAKKERASLLEELRKQMRRGEIDSSIDSGSGLSIIDQMLEWATNSALSSKQRSKLKDAAGKAEAKMSALYKQLDGATATVEDLQGVYDDVSKGLNTFDLAGSLSTAHSDAAGNTWYTDSSGSEIAGKAKAKARSIEKFADKLGQLQKAGVSAVVLQEIAGLGTEEGSRVADALLADKGSITDLNSAYADMAKFSGQAGQYVTEASYQGGLSAAKGVVEGLNAQLDQIGQDLAAAFAAALGYKIGPDGKPTKKSAGGAVAAGQMYQVNELHTEMFVPNVNGYILSSVPQQAAGNAPTMAVFSEAQINELAQSVVAAASKITTMSFAETASRLRYASGDVT